MAALVSLVAHLAAGLAMAAILGRGLETQPDLAERLAFIANQRWLWIGGWLTWNAAAVSVLYYYAAFSWLHRLHGASGDSTDVHEATSSATAKSNQWSVPEAPLRFAVVIAIVAVAADLSAEAIWMGVAPSLASQALAQSRGATAAAEMTESPAVAQFLLVHRAAAMLSGFVANGLYTFAAILLAWSARRHYPPWVLAAALVVGVLGVALSASVLAESVFGMFFANVALVPAILVWQAGVAITAWRKTHG
jgi:hypothetical protein